MVRAPEVLQAVRDLLKTKLPAELLDPVAPSSERTPAVLEVLRRAIGEQTEQGGPLRSLPTDEPTLLTMFRETIGWGPAQAYLDDERVQEVKINGTQIMVQEDGADFVLVPERFGNPEQVLERAFLLADRLNVPLDRTHPQGTLPLAHGTRMHVTIPPCTPLHTALVCIRRGRRYAWVLDDVHGRGAFSDEVFSLLRLLLRAKCSFLIAGETGSGKTALLEAIVNSWPGQPHVITIEDNTLEINIRHETWTRELVQTSVEKGAFGRAAKEALRQTPTIVAPGETRAEEAGAILTIAVSGHSVITTLHAKSCQAAVMRFADCAAMPGSYVYEGRRDNALEDACENLDVVIHVEKMSGRRYISEIALLAGTERSRGGAVRPRLIPLVNMEVDEAGQMTWVCAARAEDDLLVWEDGNERTPSAIVQKLRLLRAEGRVRAAPTSRAAVDDALTRAGQSIAGGNVDLALATLRRAWAERHDHKLINATARALEVRPERMAAAAAQSLAIAEAIEALLERRAWGEARARLDDVLSDLVLVAAISPAGRWEILGDAVTAGMDRDRDIFVRAGRAQLALEHGTHAREVIDLLGADETNRVSPEAARAALMVRRDAMTQLVAAGEASQLALDAIETSLRLLGVNQEVRDV
jgi:Flp pilus assembly CpaF family ATPase